MYHQIQKCHTALENSVFSCKISVTILCFSAIEIFLSWSFLSRISLLLNFFRSFSFFSFSNFAFFSASSRFFFSSSSFFFSSSNSFLSFSIVSVSNSVCSERFFGSGTGSVVCPGRFSLTFIREGVAPIIIHCYGKPMLN